MTKKILMKTVPKDERRNLWYRREILEATAEDDDFRIACFERAARDPVFFVDAFCLAAGTRVVTDRGLVPIERVTSADLVWDGESWVAQKGPVHQGRKSVIYAYGIHLTPDHRVMTTEGWQDASHGFDRATIRLPGGSRQGCERQHWPGYVAVPVRLRQDASRNTRVVFAAGTQEKLWLSAWQQGARCDRNHALSEMVGNEGAVRESTQQGVSSLRRSRHQGLRQMAGVVRGIHGGHGATTARHDPRQDRQQRGLLEGELPLGRRQDPGGESQGTKAEVYDLVNCGPRRSFTVIGDDGLPLLVHNCYTYAPKDHPDLPTRPFILWEFQERALRQINAAIGSHDILIEKSRDLGASWLTLTAIFYRWMFFPRQSFLLGSRKEELVDKSGSPASLYWKLDFLMEHLPGWMAPRHTRIQRHLFNHENGSTIDGESTNDDFARGDRRNAILLDEFAAVTENGHKILAASRDATNCRIFNSTPQGASGAYYDTYMKLKSHNPERILRLHWSLHPLKNKGLYTTVDNKPNGQLAKLDKNFRYPADYRFILDGKLRSPWYDEQCLRAANAQEIAQELDVDYAASGWQFFSTDVLNKLVAEMAREPTYRGELSFESKGREPQFTAEALGRLKVWCQLDGMGRPTPAEYVIGMDVATGKGGEMSSNSVASIGHRLTGQKVAQFTGNTIEPQEFASTARPSPTCLRTRTGDRRLLFGKKMAQAMKLRSGCNSTASEMCSTGRARPTSPERRPRRPVGTQPPSPNGCCSPSTRTP